MLKQKQTTPTNCFQACVATLLGIQINDVPKCCDGATWDFDAFNKWLYFNFKLQAVEVLLINDDTGLLRERLYPTTEPVPCIISGKSPRGNGKLHAVIANFTREGFELIFDPHENNAFIDGEPHHVFFFVRMF